MVQGATMVIIGSLQTGDRGNSSEYNTSCPQGQLFICNLGLWQSYSKLLNDFVKNVQRTVQSISVHVCV